MEKKTCIEARGINYGYGENLVLRHVSFKVECGDYVGIIGPNGGGKTTLIKILLGLIKPSSGLVIIQGKELSGNVGNCNIGYVPQRISTSTYDFPATVYETVLSGRTPKMSLIKPYSHNDHEKVSEAMNTTKIAEHGKRLIGELSGGERQRVFIARALAGEPEMLILDEPTTGVDTTSQARFYELLKKLNGDLNITILFISHDLDVISKEAKTVLCLNRTLICHTPVSEFNRESMIKDVYSEDVREVSHSVNEEHH